MSDTDIMPSGYTYTCDSIAKLFKDCLRFEYTPRNYSLTGVSIDTVTSYHYRSKYSNPLGLTIKSRTSLHCIYYIDLCYLVDADVVYSADPGTRTMRKAQIMFYMHSSGDIKFFIDEEFKNHVGSSNIYEIIGLCSNSKQKLLLKFIKQLKSRSNFNEYINYLNSDIDNSMTFST